MVEVDGQSPDVYLASLDPELQHKLLKSFTTADVCQDSWKEKATAISAELSLPADQVAEFGLALRRHSVLDNPSERLVSTGSRPALEVAYKDWMAIQQMQDMMTSVPRWREMVNGESKDVVEDEQKIADRVGNAAALLELLATLHLLTRLAQTGGGSTSMLPHLGELKAAVIDGWHTHHQDQKVMMSSVLPLSVVKGVTFTGIDSKVAASFRKINDIKKTLASEILHEKLLVNAQAARTRQLMEKTAAQVNKRSLERTQAKKQGIADKEALELVIVQQAIEMRTKWDTQQSTTHKALHLPPEGFAVLHLSSEQDGCCFPEPPLELYANKNVNAKDICPVLFLRSQTESAEWTTLLWRYNAMAKSRLFFFDVRKTDLLMDSVPFSSQLCHLQELTTQLTSGFQGKVCVLCTPSQQSEVYAELIKTKFTRFDGAPYLIGATTDAYTLSDVIMSGEHDVHPLLLPKAQEKTFTRLFDPIYMIISAMSLQGRPLADRDVFRKRSEYKRHVLQDIIGVPLWKGARTKYAYKFNLSKHWPVDSPYPLEFAVANFLYWHAREEDIVTVHGGLRLALTARSLGFYVLFVAKSAKTEKTAQKAFGDVSLLSDEQIKKHTFKGTHHLPTSSQLWSGP